MLFLSFQKELNDFQQKEVTMTKKVILGAVASIALSLAATPAFAQDLGLPVNSAPVGQPTTPDDRTALVVRSDWGGYRVARQGDNDVALVTLDQYRAAGHSDQDFEFAFRETQSACRDAGSWVRESIAIMTEAGVLDTEYVDLREELARLGAAQNRQSWIRRGFNIISGGLLCALSSGYYCGASVSSIIGGELQSTQHDRASGLNRRQSEINVDQSRLQLRATILTMRMNIGWANMIHGYCLDNYADQTLGF